MIHQILIAMLIFVFVLPINAIYYDFIKLRDNAEALSGRIWSGIKETPQGIDYYADFIRAEEIKYDNSAVYDRYVLRHQHQKIEYEDLLTDSILIRKQGRVEALINFATICKDIMNSKDSSALKVRATEMLFASAIKNIRDDLLNLHSYPEENFGTAQNQATNPTHVTASGLPVQVPVHVASQPVVLPKTSTGHDALAT